jgi:hypothetical protein
MHYCRLLPEDFVSLSGGGLLSTKALRARLSLIHHQVLMHEAQH